MSNSFNNPTRYSEKKILIGKLKYKFFSLFRFLRIQKFITKYWGPQYTRSREYIEIDITYHCNLYCNNCNRSSAQAPEKLHIKVEKIINFVDESINLNKFWKRIRILGGEPTLHPDFFTIINELLRYKNFYQKVIIEVVTNGNGKKVNNIISQIPKEIWVENSNKESIIQPEFGPFNLAPIDEKKNIFVDYSNGCAIMKDCGMGLTPMGYYPCAIAGGIDRIIKKNIGYKTLPDNSDNMLDLAREFCQYCGRFRDGHYIPKNIRKPILEQETSETWKLFYSNWKK
ncbi:radical SAM protein [Arcobacter lacus]|uniref:Molybdenum cofactor biosynthesis family protein n=1 Tax=Arcobacter lacus TaxID=1912876 RepID=A0ABX5JL55_9BACT|nr:radical SAM protein [Arcobacter lacus]PUE64855.1 molybdenum cofactor biosynthesis family protein [Arcobacter lacus]